MSSWPSVWLVARREIQTRVASKALRITTVLMVAAIVALTVAIDLAGGGSSAQEVGVTPQTAALAQPLRETAATIGAEVDTSAVASQAAGEQRVRDGELDALLTGTAAAPRVIVEQELDEQLQAALTGVVRQQALDRRVRALGGDPAALDRELASTRLDVRAIEPKSEHDDERLVIGMVVGVLIYIALLTFGQTVAQGVVEEKTSRVVELLLSTIRPWELMAGKVLGIGIVGLLQLLLVLATGVASGIATGVMTLPASVAAGTLAWAIAWYLLGYFLYALLFAAAGALVSRQEDVGGITTPLMMLIIIPYVIGVSALPADPDNGLVAALSLIPLFAPTLMPIREAMGSAAGWELALAAVLTLVTIAALVRIAGRVYMNAVMRTGARVRLGEALRGTAAVRRAPVE